jgi:phosphoglycolate phosphatase-like HAD superfamily hydrolase
MEAFIFDIDGTLVDSNEAHACAWVEVLGADRETVRPYIGMGSDQLIRALTGLEPGSAASNELRERKAAIFNSTYLPGLRGFPRVPELLQGLRARGMRLAVASSATGEGLATLLRIAGAQDFLPVESSVGGRSKPDPHRILGAARWLGLPPQNCVMVGDSPYDAQAAARADMRFIGLRCGGSHAAALQPSIGVYADPADLLRNIDSLLLRKETVQ